MKIANRKSNQSNPVVWIIAAVIALVLIITLIVCLIPSKESNEEPTITGISILTLPRTEYWVGEEFDPSGIVVKVNMSDASKSYNINASNTELKFSGFDSSKASDAVTVKVTYKGFVTSFDVKIIKESGSVEGTPTDIVVASFPKGIYYIGEVLKVEEILLKVNVAEGEDPVYIKGNDPEVTVSGFDSSVVNDELVIYISFRGLTTTYIIAVQKFDETLYDTIQDIAVASKPQTSYFVGQSFNPTGLRVQVITDSQETTFFVEPENPDLVISGFDSSVATNEQILTISYRGFTTTLIVTIKETPVLASPLASIEVVNLYSTYTVDEWNTYGLSLYGAYLKLTYEDGNVEGSYEDTPLIWDYVQPLSKVSAPGTINVTITYKGVSTTVTITITE